MWVFDVALCFNIPFVCSESVYYIIIAQKKFDLFAAKDRLMFRKFRNLHRVRIATLESEALFIIQHDLCLYTEIYKSHFEIWVKTNKGIILSNSFRSTNEKRNHL